jgi:peptidoglycan-associated lipoprotein
VIVISRRWFCGLFLVGFAMIAGCSTSATKPQDTSPGAGGEKGRSSTTGSASTGKSSLENLRTGESPVTPASSPLKEIYFDFDRYDLRPDARAALKANAEWLKANPSVQAQIEGHCDERGTTEYNLALGAKRAQAAKDFLVNLGIPTSRISTISFGKEAQICRERNEECWRKNRRDRFVGATRPQS